MPRHDRSPVFRARALYKLAQKKLCQRAALRRAKTGSADSRGSNDLRNLRQRKDPGRGRRVADVILRGGDFGRPWVVPPGTPEERVKILRAAHAKAMDDPQLLDEAKKGQMEVEPMSGEELQKLAETIINQPPGVIARVKNVLGN